jgi:predicted glutamine amidotransferase
MCLIVSGKSSKVRDTLLNTHGLLADIFSSNPDGLGAMYATSKGLKVIKALPKNLAEAFSFVQRLPNDDRDVALHARWTTHGHTDLDNCHPYDVVPGYIAMMHNGVLHTGNDADKARSDTYHFIKDYLAESTHKYPELIHDVGYLTMVAEFIGDNRFVFMDGDGRMSHVNHDQGIEHDGMWFSNTYAWTPTKLIPNYYSSKYGNRYKGGKYNNWAMGYSGWGDDDDDGYNYSGHGGKWSSSSYAKDDKSSMHPQQALSYAKSAHHADADEDGVIEAHGMSIGDDETACNAAEASKLLEYLLDADVDALESCLSSFPITTINTIFQHYFATPAHAKAEDMTSFEAEIFEAVIDGDMAALHDFVHAGKSARIMAEVLCFYCYWYEGSVGEDPVGDGSDDEYAETTIEDARAEAQELVNNAGMVAPI